MREINHLPYKHELSDSSKPGGARTLGFVRPQPLVVGMGTALGPHGEGSKSLRRVGKGRCHNRMTSLPGVT